MIELLRQLPNGDRR